MSFEICKKRQKLKKIEFNLRSAHFVVLCCKIVSLCTVQKRNIKICRNYNIKKN